MNETVKEKKNRERDCENRATNKRVRKQAFRIHEFTRIPEFSDERDQLSRPKSNHLSNKPSSNKNVAVNTTYQTH